MQLKIITLALAIACVPFETYAYYLSCKSEPNDLSTILLEADPKIGSLSRIGFHGLEQMRWEYEQVKFSYAYIEAYFPGSDSLQAQRWVINRITGTATLEVGEKLYGIGNPMICSLAEQKF